MFSCGDCWAKSELIAGIQELATTCIATCSASAASFFDGILRIWNQPLFK
jgi:hypothetical protein